MRRRLFWLALLVVMIPALLGFVPSLIDMATQVKGILGKTNGGTGITSTATYPSSGTVTVTVASGTSTFATTAIASLACSATVTTAATGAATTDTIEWAYATAPSATTDGRLTMNAWPTSGNVNFCRMNPTAASITPTAIVINWRVVR